MRILEVANDLDVGGVQAYLCHLLPSYAARGHEARLALVTGRGTFAAALGPAVAETPVIGRLGPWKWPRPLGVAELARLIDRFRPDVVRTHLFWGNTAGRMAALLSRHRPVLIATEHSTYFGKAAWQRRLDRWLAARTDCILAVSDAVARFTAAQEAIPVEKFLALPLGLLPTEPMSGARDPEPVGFIGRRVVGVVARLVPDKGLDWYLRVLSRLTARRPDVLGLVVGDGPQRRELEALAESLGLTDEHCRFLGAQHPVEPWLRSFSAFLLPSRREGFGLAPLEAMALGIPVVLSDLPAFRELTNRGKYGTLVPLPPHGRLQTWVEAVEAVLDRPPEPAPIQAWVAQQYGWERHVDRLLGVYAALLEQRSRTC
ncbi:MAG: glycosyltransferase [Firmicutes bacterium]|nr:glycosyltransferase [Alicyclobacillaceae bacterium]MCL6497136.1 glycosyltransferase [Bacillota bacterium]